MARSLSESRVFPWKVATFAALGLAGFFAVRTPRTAAPETGHAGAAHAGGEETTAHASAGGGGGWLPGWLAPSPSAAPDSPASKTLDNLHSARSTNALCEALTELGAIGDEAAVAAIAEIATKPRGGARGCAVAALGQSNTASARSWLTDLLDDKDADIRSKAVSALAVHVSDPENRSALFEAAHSERPDVRIDALTALGNAHVTEVSPLLLDALKAADASGDAADGDRIVAALGECHDPAAAAELTRRVNEGTASQRSEALRALGSAGGEGTATLLAGIMTSGSNEDMTTAANALAEMGDGAAHDQLMAAAKSDRPNLAAAAMSALAESDNDDVRDLMTKGLSSNDPRIVQKSSEYFGSHHEETAVPQLHDIAVHGGREAEQAVAAIAGVGGQPARDALAEIASHPGSTTQASALQQLAAMPGAGPEARALALKLVHQGGQVASTALDVLGTDTSPEGRDELLRIVHGGGNLASNALGQLARRGDAASMDEVTELAKSSKKKDLRMQALGTLGEMNDPRAERTLLDAARDSDPGIRRVALQQLATRGGPDAERAITLEATSSTANPRSKSFAISALGRLGTTEANRQLEAIARSEDGLSQTALNSLVRSSPDAAARVATQDIASTDSAKRLTAVNVASELDQDSMKQILMTGVKDEDPQVVEASARALGQLGGPDAQRALGDILTSSGSSDDQKRMAADVLNDMGGDAAERFKDTIAKYTTTSEGANDDGPSDDGEAIME